MNQKEYEQLTDDIFQEINNVRINPTSFIQHLNTIKNHSNQQFNFQEGNSIIDEAIDFLQKQQPIQDFLQRDERLDEASQELVDHIGELGIIEANQEYFFMDNRMKRFASEQGEFSENVCFGNINAKNIVLQMIIDDNIPGRGHRLNLFRKNQKKIGIACGEHKQYKHCVVIDFFGIIQDKDMIKQKYIIPEDEYPEDAISLQKHIECQSENNNTKILLTYTFTLGNGKIVKQKKEFYEQFFINKKLKFFLQKQIIFLNFFLFILLCINNLLKDMHIHSNNLLP